MFGDEIVTVEQLENGFLVQYWVPDRDAVHDDETRKARVAATTLDDIKIEIEKALAVLPEVTERKAMYIRRREIEDRARANELGL